MKRFIYNLHSWLGILAALGLLIIGLTGSVLVFKWELDAAISPELVVRQNPSQPELSRDAFVNELSRSLPNHRIVGWGKGPNPELVHAAYVVPVGKEEGRMIYVDPSTGKPTLTDLEKHQTVGDWLLKLHFSFFADHVGEALAGLFGLMLFLLGITGVIIYRKFWKTLFRLRWKMSARIFFSDVHKMVGISSTIFNLILGFTGAWWNLSHIIGHMIMDEGPSAIVQNADRHWNQNLSLDELVEQAKAKLPGYRINWISLPNETFRDIMLFGAMEGQSTFRSDYGSTVVFDGSTGQLKSAVAGKDAPLGTQILDSFRPLHYGSFGGLPVKMLWCLGGLTPGILAATGTYLWWKRKFAKKKPAPKPKR